MSRGEIKSNEDVEVELGRYQDDQYNDSGRAADLDDLEAEYDRYKSSEQNVTNLRASGTVENQYGSTQARKDSKKEDSPVDYTLFSGSSNQIPVFDENIVTCKEYYQHTISPYVSWKSVRDYFFGLFPIVHWLPHYNIRWLYSDLVAGITVGCVLVPQSMSYAQVATLPAQYGLYSSFIGAFIYSLFATSKDVCIGPVAVMSLETAKVIARVTERLPADTDITAATIATVLSLLCGIIAIGIGLLRLGFLVELISLTAVAGFMSGSAINIISGQVPALMGYGSKVNTRTSTYLVIIESLKHLPDTKLDAVFGLIPLFLLYTWKWICSSSGPRLVERYAKPNSIKAKFWLQFFFYAQALRNAVIIIVFTLIAWGITRHKSKSPISLLGNVPSGLKDVGLMKFPEGLASKLAPELPASVIVLVLEHIAISKAFGRVNDYRVVPDQELIAIGATNLIGTFFNAYPATGSFSRSALKAKCNVATPLSGVFSGCCVLVAIYCLTSAFKFIPKATLSAVIIHAVSDLVASYKTSWNFWKMNPLDFFAFIVTVIITVFSSIENGIYFAMCWSCAMLLLKVAFPSGQFLGRVEVAEVLNPQIQESVLETVDIKATPVGNSKSDVQNKYSDITLSQSSVSSYSPNPTVQFHTKWLPFDHSYTRELNPDVEVLPPPPGVIVYRPTESWTYLNASRQYDAIFDEVEKRTRRGRLHVHRNPRDRPWNDPGDWTPPRFLRKVLPSKWGSDSSFDEPVRDDRPVLRIIAMDWSQVTQTDSTGLQTLVDLRKAVNKYADRQVEFHFSGIISPWIKRALVNFGFGVVNEEYANESLLVGHASYHLVRSRQTDEESRIPVETRYNVYAASGTNTPFFHLEMPDFAKWDIQPIH
ncbi:LAFE_0H09252g1_1 [Lachancea fermentati]|uniref:LAFE_0H09252g1_1 n=1 Tax=Lachancea fermentati TaxID=4955 RepID=A0A1G4MK28_LACFM|nr:LAFE_0H09252g1_1 [Lachancea fermentati]